MKHKREKLTKVQKITLLVSIGVVFLGSLLQLLVRLWVSPDIRFLAGSYYIQKDQAVTSCTLQNYGHKTANKIIVSVKFNSQILDFQIAPISTEHKITMFDKNYLVIEIERIVPSSKILLFFTTRNPQENPFVEKIEYDQNIAKTGRPIFWVVLFIVCSYLLLTIFIPSIFCPSFIRGFL